jgi:aryl-alcohol dehydrogenase-like predicted oxidoreductase
MEETHPNRGSLPRRRLGRLGNEMATLGLGAAWLGVVPGADQETQDAAAVEAVQRAVSLGIDYVDTSPLYGASERRVGLALAQPHPEGGTWRDRVRLVTKAGTHPARRGDFSAGAIRWSIDNSLRLLQTDYLDAVLVHDPVETDPVLAPGGAVDALSRLRAEAVIGGIGIGVHDHRLLRAAIEDGRFDIIQTTYDFSLIRTTAMDAVVPLASERCLTVVNASPFHGGLLAASSESALDEMERIRDWRSHPADLERARRLHRWAASEGVDLAALAVQFCLRETRIAVTLVGPRTAQEVARNVQAALAPIPEEIWAKLAALWPTLPPPGPGGER